MKKLLFISLLIMAGCDDKGNAITGDKDFSIIVFDGCEYIQKYNGYQNGFMFSHKGNCKNQIHNK